MLSKMDHVAPRCCLTGNEKAYDSHGKMLEDETPASGDESPLEGGWEPPKETIVESRCVNEVYSRVCALYHRLLKDEHHGGHSAVSFLLCRQFAKDRTCRCCTHRGSATLDPCFELVDVRSSAWPPLPPT